MITAIISTIITYAVIPAYIGVYYCLSNSRCFIDAESNDVICVIVRTEPSYYISAGYGSYIIMSPSSSASFSVTYTGGYTYRSSPTATGYHSYETYGVIGDFSAGVITVNGLSYSR